MAAAHKSFSSEKLLLTQHTTAARGRGSTVTTRLLTTAADFRGKGWTVTVVSP